MTPQQLDAVVVGAGFGGIGAAIQLRRLGYDNFVILDREDDLGGTWHVNRYPGLAVDIPSTTYSYWFEPNPNWSRLFAPGAELKQVRRRRRRQVRRASPHAVQHQPSRRPLGRGQPELAGGASPAARRSTARFLITATGFLSQPHTPDIPGIRRFRRTDRSTPPTGTTTTTSTGRRVGVIGTGATAVQLIPELAKRVADLTVYQRTPI